MADKPKQQSMPAGRQAQDIVNSARLWSITSEIGFKIAIPLVVFLLIGLQIDAVMQTKPLFMLVGMVLALASSAYLVYLMIKRVTEAQA